MIPPGKHLGTPHGLDVAAAHAGHHPTTDATHGLSAAAWRALLIEMARRILRIRRFEETAARLSKSAEIPGALHLSIGQEGEIVGACMALRTDDYMAGNHRSHGHPIGKGAGLNGLMAELMGKSTGVNHGKGGSMQPPPSSEATARRPFREHASKPGQSCGIAPKIVRKLRCVAQNGHYVRLGVRGPT